MPRSSSISWTIRQLMSKMDGGKLCFDNAVQRNKAWNVARASLFVHTAIITWMRNPQMVFKKTPEGYDVIEGKQRLTFTHDFIHDLFALKGIPETDADGQPFMNDDDEIIHADQLEGKKFSELDPKFQEAILNYQMYAIIYDGLSDGQTNEVFFRNNNGKPLSATEITRVQIKCKEAIAAITCHPIFTHICTEAGINRYAPDTIAYELFAVLFTDNPSFETKKLRPLIKSADIDMHQVHKINAVLTRLMNIYDFFFEMSTKDGVDPTMQTAYKNVAKKLAKKSHLTCIAPLMAASLDEGISEENMKNWTFHFFSPRTGCTSSDSYNFNAGSSSSAATNAIKLKAIADDFAAYRASHELTIGEPYVEPQDENVVGGSVDDDECSSEEQDGAPQDTAEPQDAEPQTHQQDTPAMGAAD